jgi:ribosome-associated protein YbcJ (S4-like RNA binding protein)
MQPDEADSIAARHTARLFLASANVMADGAPERTEARKLRHWAR